MSVMKEDTVEYMNLVTSSIKHDVLFENGSIINAIYGGELAEAEQICIQRIKTNQDDYYAWSFYGLVLMLKGDDSKALEALDRAYLIDANNVLGLNLRGDCHYNLGDAEQGEVAYYLSLDREWIQLHPRRMLYYQYMTSKRFDRALRVIEPALKMNPDDEGTWSQIRDSMSKLGYIGFAEGVLYYLVREFPQKYMPWYLRANLLLALDKLEEAEVAIRKALELNSEYALSWVLLATILDRLGRSEEAVECCQEAVNLEPENPYPWYSYSMFLLKIGKRMESKKAISKAVSLDSKKAKEILSISLGTSEQIGTKDINHR